MSNSENLYPDLVILFVPRVLCLKDISSSFSLILFCEIYIGYSYSSRIKICRTFVSLEGPFLFSI
jgi:hypothetical protein